jgi:predicted ester cyclase
MVLQCRPLIEVLADMPDFRHARGLRHRLHAILTHVCATVRCGYRSYRAMAQRTRVYPSDHVQTLAATGKSIAFGGIDVYRVVDGRIVEGGMSYDRLVILQQIGATPVH